MKIKNYSIIVAAIMLAILVYACGGNGGAQSKQDSGATKMEQQSEKDALAGLEKGDAEKGKPLFVQFCSACHGPDALGIKGLGKDLVHSEFVKEETDAELLKYVNEGRPVDDPRNTTGIPMPPKGGNPALTNQQIVHIIAYLRTIEEPDTTNEEPDTTK